MNGNQSTIQNVTIKNMTKQENETAIQWAKAEGWNPGLHDAECFYHADPNGFYAAEKNGEIIGTASIVKYSKDFAFAGLYIVKPEFRKKGVGAILQQFIMEKSRNLNLGLDSVLSMQTRYEQAGFKKAYNNTRYAGTIKGVSSNKCISIQKEDLEEVAAFDAKFFPARRTRFLECWLYQKDASAHMIRENFNGAIRGYGVIRRCFQGYKVGPLFAEDAKTAELLLSSLAITALGDTVFLDVPEPNTDAVALAKRFGMQPVFSTVRMYTKTEPVLPLEKIFGVTTFELG